MQMSRLPMFLSPLWQANPRHLRCSGSMGPHPIWWTLFPIDCYPTSPGQHLSFADVFPFSITIKRMDSHMLGKCSLKH